MTFVLMKRDPLQFATNVAGRPDVGGHLKTHKNLWKVKTWKTRNGVERWLDLYPNWRRDFIVVTYQEAQEAIDLAREEVMK